MTHSIARALNTVRRSIPPGVELVAVSKFHPAEAVAEAYAAGQRVFGESRIQELLPKAAALPADIRWHFIGHLQTNKVRQLVAARCVSLIESVDSERLLRLIDDESLRAGTVTRLLLQAHVAAEETKFGFDPAELLDFFVDGRYRSLQATHICGIMGMATNTDDPVRVAADFRRLADLRKTIVAACPDLRGFDILSMGMSHDYLAAIAEGSTMVRIGTAIFGERDYAK